MDPMKSGIITYSIQPVVPDNLNLTCTSILSLATSFFDDIRDDIVIYDVGDVELMK